MVQILKKKKNSKKDENVLLKKKKFLPWAMQYMMKKSWNLISNFDNEKKRERCPDVRSPYRLGGKCHQFICPENSYRH